jgi:hypothetical protein
MAWNPNIPQATDQINVSQGDILANFTALDPIFNGINNFISFPGLGGTPTFSAGNDGLYNINYATTSLNELFVHKQTAAGTANIPMTASILSTVAAPAANATSWTYLPSGILLRWGQGSGTGTVTYTIGAPGPAFNGIITVLVTPVSTTPGDVDIAVRMVSILSNTQFQVYVSKRTTTGAGTGSFNVLIIGY